MAVMPATLGRRVKWSRSSLAHGRGKAEYHYTFTPRLAILVGLSSSILGYMRLAVASRNLYGIVPLVAIRKAVGSLSELDKAMIDPLHRDDGILKPQDNDDILQSLQFRAERSNKRIGRNAATLSSSERGATVAKLQYLAYVGLADAPLQAPVNRMAGRRNVDEPLGFHLPLLSWTESRKNLVDFSGVTGPILDVGKLGTTTATEIAPIL